jgi:pimeloyl-ACP methyl ester carboxylesterase
VALYACQTPRGSGGHIRTTSVPVSRNRRYAVASTRRGPKAAPALILLHGFGSSLQTWDEGAHDLEADHRVIRYDLPGFGLDYTIVMLALVCARHV